MTAPTKLSDLSAEAQLELGLNLGSALIFISDLQAQGQLRFFLVLSVDDQGHVVCQSGVVPGVSRALVVGAIEETKLGVRQQMIADSSEFKRKG